MADISVKHEVLRRAGRIRFRKFTKGGYDQFKIRLSLSGPLSQIEYVEYELHPTFRDPVQISKDQSAGFPIEFWTWGEFEIFVTARFLDGHDEELTYYLKYSSELPPEHAAYYDETPESIWEVKDE